MKTLSVLLLQCLTVLTSASTQEAYIYTHDVQPRSSDHPNSISSETAYSIWARRLGQSEQRRLSSVDDTILQQIDQFGGHQVALFDDAQKKTEPSRLSIVIEGYDDDAARMEQAPDLTVAKPSQYLADGLSLSLNAKMEYASKWSFDTEDRVGVYLELGFAEPCGANCQEALEESLWMRDHQKEHLQRILSFLTLDLLSPSGNKVKLASLHLDYTRMTGTTAEKKSSMIRNFVSYVQPRLAGPAASGSQESTVVLLPTISKSKLKHTHQARQSPEDEEEPLSISTSVPFDTTTASNSSGPIKLGPGNFLPLCFNTADACANGTNSCSGHGSCYRKYEKCFACRCNSTIVRHNDDGTTKSVQWGGTACEKKDVSVPFFLFASLGVVMTALVAGGIGLLFNMGAEDLPSVIGAGVAGPRATK